MAATAARAQSRSENSYDFVRFCAASFVLFSHHFDLAGRPEPKVPGLGEDFGELGVEIFFCLSGFLICRSLQRNPDWAHFVAARMLRIFPNLLFVLVVTSAVTLVWYGNYANLWPHIHYVVSNLVMFVNGVTFTIPGIFTDTVRAAVNEPLWTLPYELWCYALLFLMFAVAAAQRPCVVFGALSSASPGPQHPRPASRRWSLNGADFFRLGSYFLSGAVLALFWPHLKSMRLRSALRD